MFYILIGDIGGTNIRLFLVQGNEELNTFSLIHKNKYKQNIELKKDEEVILKQQFTNLKEAIHFFMSECSLKIIKSNPNLESSFKEIKYKKLDFTDNIEGTHKEFAYKKFWDATKDSSLPALFAGCAIAGNTINNRVEKLANINWTAIDGQEIKDEMGFANFNLLNDFHANGFGVLSLKDSNLITVNNHLLKKYKEKRKKELSVVMGMGTGLGVVSVLTHQTKQYKKQESKKIIKLFLDEEKKMVTEINENEFNKNVLVMPSEGGHLGFPIFDSENDFDNTFQDYIRKELNIEFNFISQEHLFCGPIIPLIFKHFAKLENKEDQIPQKLDGKIIMDMALKGNKLAKQTYEKFLEYCGQAMYNEAVVFMLKDNLVLVGNIINSVYKKLYKKNKKLFWKHLTKRYLMNSHFKKIFEKIKIIIYNDEDLMGINGMFNYIYMTFVKSTINNLK